MTKMTRLVSVVAIGASLPIHKIAELDDPKSFSPKSKRLVVKKGALVALVQMALVLATQL
jgi:hypothetical protein